MSLERAITLVDADTIDLDALGTLLDEGDHALRLSFIRALSPKRQRRLFDAAQGRRVSLDMIVPSHTAPLTEIIHEGQNTLPAFRHFQKRFCLPSPQHAPAGRELLWGYNHQTMSGFTGPGYFVAYEDPDTQEVCVDYRELPPEHPAAWPEILSNKAKLGFLVYAGMVDRLRRVSQHVTIGRAYKGKPMSAWFALTRLP